MGPLALVSIIIPAYKATFLEAALRSAFAQDYPRVEIVIGDDCPTNAVAEIVERLRPESPWPIKYVRNLVQLREAPNVTQCVNRATGEYVKFLYDDDVLLPACVRRQVETLEAYPGLSLVTARRRLIDETDRPLPDTYATCFPFNESTRVHGADLTSFLGEYTYNFIGEPTSVLCRRADLLGFGNCIFGLDGQHISWLGDLAIYAKLMRLGDIAMLDEVLTCYRVSTLQSSQGGREDSSGPQQFHELFRKLLHQLGWVRPPEKNAYVQATPLALGFEGGQGTPFNLATWLHEVLPGYAQPEFKRWLQARRLGPARQRQIDAYAQSSVTPALLIVLNDLSNDEPALLRSLHSVPLHMPLYANAMIVVLSSRPNVGGGKVQDRFYWVSSNLEQRSGHLNQLITEVAFDWLICLEAGEIFNADALSVTTLELIANPECPAIFCDEVYSDSQGGLWPLLRGNFNLDQLLSVPLAMARHWLFRRDTLVAMDGFDGGVPEALELDMILRCLEAGRSGFGHISEPLIIFDAPSLEPCEDERLALLHHLQRRGYRQSQIAETTPRHYLLTYGNLNEALPSVAVLVPAKGPVGTLERCVASTSLLSNYTNFQVVLVETEDTTDELARWISELEHKGFSNVLVIRSARTFPFNRAMNEAVEVLEHDYMVFLDPACVIVEPAWLQLLLDQAMRPEVAAVGGRRVERGEHLQDAGLRLGLEGPAETTLLTRQDGPLNYIQVQRNTVAVSCGCLMVARALFQQVGGFDDVRFRHRWADVDLCLKLHWAGHLNVWAPQAWVAMTEPVRAPSVQAALDEEHMYQQWRESLGRDSCASYLYAPRGSGFDFDVDAQLMWRPLAFARLPVIVGVGSLDSTDLRIAQPLQSLREAGMLEGGLTQFRLGNNEWLRVTPGSVVVPYSPVLADYGLDSVHPYLAPYRVCDLAAAADADIDLQTLQNALRGFDKVLVATQAQAERVAGSHSHIEVLPTRLPPSLWKGLALPRTEDGKVRVGMVCEASDLLDLVSLAALMHRFHDCVQWVVYGALPEVLRPFVDEYHPAVAAHRYPAELSRLNLDIAVVMLTSGFSQSAIAEQRVLEHGACGTAVISNHFANWRGMEATQGAHASGHVLQEWLTEPARRKTSAAMLHAEVIAKGFLEGDQATRWLAAWHPVTG